MESVTASAGGLKPRPQDCARRDALLGRARALLAALPGFRQLPPAEQEIRVREEARAVTLYASPIGQAATRVYDAVTALQTAIEHFLEHWPDEEAALQAGTEALGRAGLGPDTDPLATCTGDYFLRVPGELAGWHFLVELLAERIAECDRAYGLVGG